MAGYGFGFNLGNGHIAYVDQVTTPETKIIYKQIAEMDWFYRKGFAYVAEYDRESKKILLLGMHELIFGGPCIHLNGNTLDNRRKNLSAPIVEQDEAITDDEPVTILVA